MQKFSAESISAFCMDFRTISYYFPMSLTDCFLESSVFTVRYGLGFNYISREYLSLQGLSNIVFRRSAGSFIATAW
jgi:hypothetical protein